MNKAGPITSPYWPEHVPTDPRRAHKFHKTSPYWNTAGTSDVETEWVPNISVCCHAVYVALIIVFFIYSWQINDDDDDVDDDDDDIPSELAWVPAPPITVEASTDSSAVQ